MAAKIQSGRKRSRVDSRRIILLMSASLRGSSLHSRFGLASFFVKRVNTAKTGADAADEVLMDGMFRCCKAVIRELEVAFYLDETHSAQVGEMPRHSWLRKVEYLDDVAYAQFAGGKETQYPDSSRIGKALEYSIKVINCRSAHAELLPTFRKPKSGCHIWHNEYNMARRI